MAKDSSPLADAAAEFDKELAAYARLGKLFIETPLSSVKYLERANTTLNEIAQCEERLQLAGQTLVRVLSASRGEQEQLASAVVAHVPALQARNERLKELMIEMGAVAAEVAGLNDVIAGKKTASSENGDASRGPTQADALDVSQTVLGLSARAESLANTARDAEFEEVATQAHSLHQRLQAIGKK